MILLIDNYDSFAHNLARYFRQLEQPVHVVRNNEIDIHEIDRLAPAALVMSPGPCTPAESGICLEAVKQFSQSIPMLGVCLGHQAICQASDASIDRVMPRHGQASHIHHTGHPLFDEIETPFVAGRYHSLTVNPGSVPNALQVIATSDDGIVMGVAHRDWPVFGVQFHPESILTPYGYRILANFLTLANLPVDMHRVVDLTTGLREQTASRQRPASPRHKAVTPHPWQKAVNRS